MALMLYRMSIHRQLPDGTWETVQPWERTAQRSTAPVDRTTPVYLTREPALSTGGDPDPLSLIPVYRAVQVLTTAAAQLPLVVERQGRLLSGTALPALLRRPSLELDRSEFIAQCVMSLAMTGELFLHRIRSGTETLEVRVVDPVHVSVTQDPNTRVLTYHYNGSKWSAEDFDHQVLMRRPGSLRGFGPLQAARSELSAQRDVRDYSANWFHGTGHPSGILASDQPLTGAEAQNYRDQWNGYDRETGDFRDRDGSNPSGIRVLGKGLDYKPIFLNPEDAQWVEVRQFNVTDIARLFGVPSSLMLVSLDGNSQTYSNVEQEWLAFTRFTLMGYLRRIEEALTHLTPLGQVVRFNLEALLRSDTKSRYESYEIGIRSGWLTPDEARGHENLPPLTPAQAEQIAAAKTTPATTVQESTP